MVQAQRPADWHQTFTTAVSNRTSSGKKPDGNACASCPCRETYAALAAHLWRDLLGVDAADPFKSQLIGVAR
jgi:hypothetical protein